VDTANASIPDAETCRWRVRICGEFSGRFSLLHQFTGHDLRARRHETGIRIPKRALRPSSSGHFSFASAALIIRALVPNERPDATLRLSLLKSSGIELLDGPTTCFTVKQDYVLKMY
jgi:hypothetical protein